MLSSKALAFSVENLLRPSACSAVDLSKQKVKLEEPDIDIKPPDSMPQNTQLTTHPFGPTNPSTPPPTIKFEAVTPDEEAAPTFPSCEETTRLPKKRHQCFNEVKHDTQTDANNNDVPQEKVARIQSAPSKHGIITIPKREPDTNMFHDYQNCISERFRSLTNPATSLSVYNSIKHKIIPSTEKQENMHDLYAQTYLNNNTVHQSSFKHEINSPQVKFENQSAMKDDNITFKPINSIRSDQLKVKGNVDEKYGDALQTGPSNHLNNMSHFHLINNPMLPKQSARLQANVLKQETTHGKKEVSSVEPQSFRMFDAKNRHSVLGGSPQFCFCHGDMPCRGHSGVLSVPDCNGDGLEIIAELVHADLWSSFHSLGTEMIITKSGRRMFPAFKVRLSGLNPRKLYTVKLEFLQPDSRKYRYIYHSSQWVISGSGDSITEPPSYVIPDGPISGKDICYQVISFERLKLTNMETLRPGQVSLVSMQKFQPRVVVEEQKSEMSVGQLERYQVVFPQTSFIAVTAYQNQQITTLKIASNPFAKGFRDAGKTRPPFYTSSTQVPGPPFNHGWDNMPHHLSDVFSSAQYAGKRPAELSVPLGLRIPDLSHWYMLQGLRGIGTAALAAQDEQSNAPGETNGNCEPTTTGLPTVNSPLCHNLPRNQEKQLQEHYLYQHYHQQQFLKYHQQTQQLLLRQQHQQHQLNRATTSPPASPRVAAEKGKDVEPTHSPATPSCSPDTPALSYTPHPSAFLACPLTRNIIYPGGNDLHPAYLYKLPHYGLEISPSGSSCFTTVGASESSNNVCEARCTATPTDNDSGVIVVDDEQCDV